MAANLDYEQAGELKFGQVGIANLRVRTLDPARLAAEMAERVQRAPKLFARAAVVVDFGGLSQCPSVEQTQALLEALRGAGVLPVALAYGTSAIESLSREVGLPLLAKFRASYEREGEAAPAPAPVARTPEPAPAPAPAAPAPRAEPGLVHLHPVRSGQQVYAQERDLTVCATVGAGAEVIADGSIHVYAPLRGKAIAGAKGNTEARIFSICMEPELLSIAGTYRTTDTPLPPDVTGKPAQIRLEGDRLVFDPISL